MGQGEVAGTDGTEASEGHCTSLQQQSGDMRASNALRLRDKDGGFVICCKLVIEGGKVKVTEEHLKNIADRLLD